PFVPFRVTSAHLVGLGTWGGMIALGWASLFRTTIVLDVDHLTVRSWPFKRAVPFSELSSVDFVGSGDRQVLVLALHGGERFRVSLLSFAARERAILADVLGRYRWRRQVLTERELRAMGRVTRGTIDWIGEWSSPYWAFTYRYADATGTPRSGRAFGLAVDILKRREGETGDVRYDERGASL